MIARCACVPCACASLPDGEGDAVPYGRPRLLDDPVSGPAQGGEEEARQVRGHLLEAYGDGGGWAAALPGTKRRR